MRKTCLILLFLLLTNIALAGKVILLNVKGPIGPAVQDYITRGINYAENEHASAVLIKLDTPGGLETSMRGINEAIISAKIPVITYVAPEGARAASAGTFIMYASHFSAMAPGTNIGAASPVQLFSGTNPTDKKPAEATPEEKKAVNDASAYIRSLAQLRGRNIEWGESAVRQAASLSGEEAKKLKVIDETADSDTELLNKLDGRQTLIQGKLQKVSTKDATIESKPPDWRYDFLSFLTNPNIAYILMLIAMYGLFFELANPGAILPGVVGIIALLLVLYAFQLLPINYAGLALVVIGVFFMLFEIYVSSFGIIGIGGIIAFIIGSIMLFDVHDPNFRVTWQLILIMSMVTAIFFLMVLGLAIRSHKKAIVTGAEGLMGYEGEVLSIMNEQIVVRVAGEIWNAKSSAPLKIGDKIKVKQVTGLTLIVVPIENHRS